MTFGFSRRPRLETERLTLRLASHDDWRQWADLRADSAAFLTPWEPVWSETHLSRRNFSNRVYWGRRAEAQGTAVPFVLIRRADQRLLGAITLDNIRRGPAQTAMVGYWIGAPFARHGYMREALEAVVHYAFARLDLSRIEAACLPENAASRGVLEKCGFKFEGVFQSYLQINGRWRNHVIYSRLRNDRRGRTAIGPA
ncbi:GNAT family N-acetyltransferase [Pseudogemmobacter sonorensis]|uniref:GNAT family N-acetyltransferase n=1 Tax=Pseudogemmobacter sonorensis TaxID=2989681 RepID=UPI0036B16AF3